MGKTELTYNQKELLNGLNCSIYFKENLHAKCYANETEALKDYAIFLLKQDDLSAKIVNTQE